MQSHERLLVHRICSLRPSGAGGIILGRLPRMEFAMANSIRGYSRRVPPGRNSELGRCGQGMYQTWQKNSFVRLPCNETMGEVSHLNKRYTNAG
jgi:hypothetical protein